MSKEGSGNNLKHAVAKGFLWGGMSNVVCQVLNIFFTIFLARILTPEDYGPIGMLAIFSAIAMSLQDSGFVAAIANRKEVKHDDYNSVFWFSILISILMYSVLYACAPLLASFFNQPVLIPLSRYSFLGFVVSGFGIAPSAYLFRELKVKEKSIALMLSIAISGTVGVVMALKGFSYWGIATQSLVYVLVRTVVCWYYTPWHPTIKVDFSPLRYLFAFSYRLLITSVFQRFNWNIFSFILGKFYSTTDVGNYTKAAELFNTGGEVVNGMVNAVAQPVLAKVAEDNERQLRVFRKMLKFTAFVAFPFMLGMSLVAKELVVVFFTFKWIESAGILQILAVWGAFMPIQSMLTHLLVSRGRTRIFMWCTIVQGLLTLAMLFAMSPYGIKPMLVAYCVFNIAWLFVWTFFIRREISLTFTMFVCDLLPYMLLSTAVMFAAYGITSFIENVYLLLVARILIVVVLYITAAWAMRSNELSEIIIFLFKRKRMFSK